MSAWNAQPGVRSPDGRWYWDGRQWIPTGGPAPVPPPPGPGPRPGPAPRRGKSPLKFVLIALGLIALLVVVGVGGVVALGLNSQGVIQLPFLPANVHTVMQKPLQGTLRDAHIQIQLKDKKSGKVETEQGVVTFSPKMALSETASGSESFPTVVANGLEYENRGGDIGWTAQPENGTSPLGFLSWSLTDPEPGSLDSIVGQESTADGLAWHVKDYTGNYHWWIRQADGFPIKATNERAFVDVTYTFSQFNSGATVKVPSDVATNIVDGRVGQGVTVPGVARVSVDQVRDHLSTGLFGGGAHGYRLVGVHVSYTHRGDRPLEVFPLDFPVTDSQGFVGIPSSTGQGAPSPAFPDQNVTPGQTVSGWLIVQVRDGATGLTMQIGDPNAVGRIPLNLG